ncbi:hypothetical protein C5167_016560 [Papaver somniferum]|nr:hypothetical protein C5167_016560 [Papaver somniferum]
MKLKKNAPRGLNKITEKYAHNTVSFYVASFPNTNNMACKSFTNTKPSPSQPEALPTHLYDQSQQVIT